MQNNYQVLNLTNGLTLVGDVEWSVDSAIVTFPLEVSSKAITDDAGKVVGEHMMLKPYLVMTDEIDVVIDQYNIISSNKLAERLVQSYEDMVSTVYESSRSYGGCFLKKELDDNASEEIIDEIQKMTAEEAKQTKDKVDQILDSLEALRLDKKDTNKKLH